jgi:hypothetical protein
MPGAALITVCSSGVVVGYERSDIWRYLSSVLHYSLALARAVKYYLQGRPMAADTVKLPAVEASYYWRLHKRAK